MLQILMITVLYILNRDNIKNIFAKKSHTFVFILNFPNVCTIHCLHSACRQRVSVDLSKQCGDELLGESIGRRILHSFNLAKTLCRLQ